MVSNAPVLKRAHHPAQQADRRRHILQTARSLLAEVPYEQLAMARIARQAEIAKGTVYLYFPAKEAVFVALISEEFDACFDALGHLLDALPAPASPDAVASAFTRAIGSRPLLLRLIGLLHVVLEHNIDEATARRFKQSLRDRLIPIAATLERLLPQCVPGDGFRLMLNAHILSVGWQHAADPAPVIRTVQAEPPLSMFAVDFATEFQHTFSAVLRGWTPGGFTHGA
ncbi:TetR family transcriptional regulator [Algiphilus sp.]|uniref:TetR family transcriptional regulator n=1 Tax=Algiphilus sp. TaxID=1872431 RepID=UPI003B518E8F